MNRQFNDVNGGHGLCSWRSVVAVYAVTTGIVALGFSFAAQFVTSEQELESLSERLTQFDAGHYVRIVEEGYSYDPLARSELAFFPLFPLLGKVIAGCTGLPAIGALLIAANVTCLTALIALAFYLRLRDRDARSELLTQRHRLALNYAVVLMVLLPTSLFFRMAYAESLFVLLAILCLLAIEVRARFIVIILLAGLASATRPVGIALVLPVMVAAWNRHHKGWPRYAAALGYGLVSCWGLALYILYQWHSFGEPFAFALTQAHWRMRPPTTVGEKMVSLLSYQPIWSVYDPLSMAYWGRWGNGPWFNVRFLNPVYFVGTAVTVVIGAYARLLTRAEVLLALGLLLIPYLTRAYENAMFSHARFALVVFPAFIVWGHALARMPMAVVASLFGLMGFLLGCYSALFAAGHPFF